MARDIPPKSSVASVDVDGDMNVVRKQDISTHDGVILIEHQSSTTLDLVGEKVWRGAFVLADLVLLKGEELSDGAVLELASGVGLTSVVASMVANKVVVTDVDRGDILGLVSSNLRRNESFTKAQTFVREIDFFDHRTITDIANIIDDVTVILVADVVYHNQLTDAFFETALCLMKLKPNKVMYIALEKRYVFTMEDFDTVAPCYDHFLLGLEWLMSQEKEQVTWDAHLIQIKDVPQYFTYERTKDLVLWRVEAKITD